MRRETQGHGRQSLALKLFAILTATVAIWSGRPASAQIETQPSWAVVEFTNKGPATMPVGKMASDAVIAELQRQAKVDVTPPDTVARQAADLGFQPPITKNSEVQRLGQALQAVTVVTGEVVNWRIVTKPEGKQAQVLIRLMVWDVAAGLTINGSAVGANSDFRTGDVSDEELVKAAVSQGAFDALANVNARTMPSATVLNTLQNRALINKGARAGFLKDQRVVVTRGKSLVAEGIVRDVDPDSSFIETTRSFRGIQPGDKIRTIFDVPELKDGWGKDGSAQVRKTKSGGSNSGLVSLVIVLLILGFLLANGHGSNQDGVGAVNAEAIMLASDVPAVRISWTRDSFFRGTTLGPTAFQVWRDGDTSEPVTIGAANVSFAYNDRDAAYGGPNWYDFQGIVGGNTCLNTDDQSTARTAGFGAAIPGTPYNYSVSVVYRVSCFDLPDTSQCTSGGSTSGSTSGNTGGTGSTGGTGTTGTTGTTGSTGSTGSTGTTGTTGGNSEYCYFESARVAASGQATPLVRSTLRSPDDNAIVAGPITFGFTSVRGNVSSIPIEYVVQFSDRQDFPANRTFTTDPFVELVLPGGQPVSSPTIDTSTVFPTASVLYWRVGARNPEDVPGPVADASGQRYIKSAIRHFRRPSTPHPTKG